MHKLWSILLIFLVISCSEESSRPAPDNVNTPKEENPFNLEEPSECLAVDTDGDGIIDCEDPDKDNDGRLNEVDAFPYDALEWIDTDGDSTGDNSDVFPLDPSEWIDSDNDTMGNNFDFDDDNDGVPDIFEDIGLSENENDSYDIDNDGLGDINGDTDKDNDGIPNIFDDIDWKADSYFDIDNDFTENKRDSDMDGDSVNNAEDAFPFDVLEWEDSDGDNVGNNIDPDNDNDGFPDKWEDFPNSKDRQFDTDGDLIANEDDIFPFDETEWEDSDGDNVGNNTDPFPNDSTEWRDTDSDGRGDNSDEDIDNDGFQNCIPLDLLSSEPCNNDIFPYDREEWRDFDLDLIGDNKDYDDDNDTIPDIFDYFPKDRLHFSDFDEDGVPDSTFPETPAQAALLEVGQVFFVFDEDVDNDGIPNEFDDLVWNRYDAFDIDGDKLGSRFDLDDDGDSYNDVDDLFPFDISEWEDKDNDLIGDNLDSDDDNEGVPDIWDSLKYNVLGYSDINNDERPDQGNLDIDNDGVSNDSWECNLNTISPTEIEWDCGFKNYQLYPHNYCSFPKYYYNSQTVQRDIFIWDEKEFEDKDIDCLGDKFEDFNDDNDPIPDIFDDFPVDNVVSQSYSLFDIDNDGIPNFTVKFDSLLNQNVYAFDKDIDNDGDEQGLFSCQANASNPTWIDCYFESVLIVEDPVTGEELNIIYFDAFPFNPDETRDTDGDLIGDNKDLDIDGDGISNCEIQANNNNCVDEDELKFIGNLHPFVQEFFALDPDNPIPYCANIADCHYKVYDQDNDGFTDYEEFVAGTNPLDADTDGDTIPDPVEWAEGTDGLDPNSWLDEDNDGLANFHDKTPRGAFDEASLRKQITNSSECRTKIVKSLCNDGETDLCEWELLVPTQLIENPIIPGDFIEAGKCVSKEILVTENISIDDCLSFNGEVKITSQERKVIEFTSQILNGPRCSGNDVRAIKADENSNLTISNITFKGENIDRVIESIGSSVSLVNVAFDFKHKNMTKIIEMNRPSDGYLHIKNSTVKSSLVDSEVPSSDLQQVLDINVSNLEFIGNIFNCDLKANLLSVMNEVSCFDLIADQSNFSWNLFIGENNSVIPSNYSGNIPIVNTVSLNSISSSNFNNKTYIFSNMGGLNLYGTGFTYNLNDIYSSSRLDSASIQIIDGEETLVRDAKINVNNSLLDVNEFNEFSYQKTFSQNDPLEIKCSTVAYNPEPQPDPLDPSARLNYVFARDVNPALVDARPFGSFTDIDPIFSDLNLDWIYMFNSNSNNLSPEGKFDSVQDSQAWISGEYGEPGIYSIDTNSMLIKAGNPGPSGIKKTFSGLDINKNYQMSFTVKAFSEEDNVKFIVSIVDSLDENSVLKRFEITNGSAYSRIVDENGNISYSLFFDEIKTISEKFSISIPDVTIKIENNNNQESSDILIDDIEILESIQYKFQYMGINKPFCSI